MVHPNIWYTPTFGTPQHLVHPDIWYTQTFGTPRLWYTQTFGTPRHLVHPDNTLPCKCVTERVYQMSWTFCTSFPYRFLTERVYQMSMTFGTPFPYRFFTERVYQMSMTFGTPFLTCKRVYGMSGCTKWYWTTCQGVPNVRVYQMSVDLLSGYQMSGCTKCQGVPNVIGVPNIM